MILNALHMLLSLYLQQVVHVTQVFVEHLGRGLNGEIQQSKCGI